jgi:hypothetical protein
MLEHLFPHGGSPLLRERIRHATLMLLEAGESGLTTPGWQKDKGRSRPK